MEGGGGERARAGYARIRRCRAVRTASRPRWPLGEGLSLHYMSLRSLLHRLFEPEDTTTLRESVEQLHVSMRRLEEEWTEVYGKFRTLQLRVAKHVQRLEKDSSQEEPQGAEREETTAGTTFSTLSPRAQLIQKQILERRARRGQNGGE